MTNLLLKTKTELFKWLQQQLCNGERERDSERERERDTQAQTPAGNSEKLQGSIFLPVSIQSSIQNSNCEQHSRLLPEHVNMFI